MKRNAIQDLINWKNDEERKPLVLKGARQVGKTWLMKEFGRTAYADAVYINFDSNSVMADLFAADLNTDRLILGIEMYCGHKIDAENTLLIFDEVDEEDELKSIFEANKNPQRILELLSLICGEKILPGETLIIFDEIQECPEALNTLKYFKEKSNEYHVIAAGSLLGTLLAKPKSYPVGMVNLLDIYPLNFEEFLEATDPALYAYYESSRSRKFSTIGYWKLITITSLSAVCRNAWHPGSIIKTRQGSLRSSVNLLKSMKTTSPSITARSTADAS